MSFRSIPVSVILLSLVFNQSAATAYDQVAEQQIQQIQQQLEQQFPQQTQQSKAAFRQSYPQSNTGISQGADAQQQIEQINQQLQQMTHQQAMPMAQPQVWQQGQMMQNQMPQAQMQMQQVQGQQQQPRQQSNQSSGFSPTNSQSLNLPVLNSSMSGYTSVNDVVPNQVGATSGVDILDESLKFHSQVNGQPSQPAMMSNQNFNAGAGSNATCNHVSSNAGCNHATVVGGTASGCCQHSQANNSTNNANNSANGGQISTRAIGAIGAAALVGTFLNNGGVGGMIKSVGWDNTRHTRGMSIGGY